MNASIPAERTATVGARTVRGALRGFGPELAAGVVATIAPLLLGIGYGIASDAALTGSAGAQPSAAESVAGIWRHNLGLCAVILAGALVLGIPTLWLTTQWASIGCTLGAALAAGHGGRVLRQVGPHAVPELAGFSIAAAVSFCLVRPLWAWTTGRDGTQLRAVARQATCWAAVGAAALTVAAVIEGTVSTRPAGAVQTIPVQERTSP